MLFFVLCKCVCICVYVRTCMGSHTCVGYHKGHSSVAIYPYIFLHYLLVYWLLLETGSLTGLELVKKAVLSGQRAPRTHSLLPPQ